MFAAGVGVGVGVVQCCHVMLSTGVRRFCRTFVLLYLLLYRDCCCIYDLLYNEDGSVVVWVV